MTGSTRHPPRPVSPTVGALFVAWEKNPSSAHAASPTLPELGLTWT